MQAIETRYLPPTNTKPSRIKASCERGSITVSWHHGLDAELNHVGAAFALRCKFIAEDKAKYGEHTRSAWNHPIVSGALKKSYAHVFFTDPIKEARPLIVVS